jgi:hypothetical protein
MRKALVVGIDYYARLTPLHGCVYDAKSVRDVLESHGDVARTTNFGVKLLAATDANDAVSRGDLKDQVEELFGGQHEIALFYFAGHGHVEATGGYLCSSDCRRGDDGLALDEVMTLAKQSRSNNKIILLDSCHSGVAGNPAGQLTAELSEGMTILTAATKEQYATETNCAGVFTSLLVDALSGPAANLVGDVTPGSVYAHIDQSLGPWRQRPLFKTNVSTFVSLRRVQPPIVLEELKQLTAFFPTAGFDFQLDPSFEPEIRGRPDGAPPPNPEHTRKFALLQKYNRVNLLKPVGAPHMWHAAIESKSCKLTALGEHYRSLVEEKLI